MNNTGSLRTFIWQQGFAIGALDYRQLADDFVSEMQLGIEKHPSSLAMLPSFLQQSFDQQVSNSETVIVMDAGGSHLRIALANINNNSIELAQLQTFPMPGSQSASNKQNFFETLCRYLENYLPYSEKIGFCFSYPCEISPELDGKLLRWTKEVEAEGVEGLWIGKELNDYLEQQGHQRKRIFILNDTVACLLANTDAPAHEHSLQIGLILGTGTNCAFKSSVHQDIINIESGSYAHTQDFPADHNLHTKCHDQHHYNFEKKISGRYLGSLYLELLILAAEHHLFSRNTQASLKQFYQSGQTFTSEHLHALLEKQQLPFDIDIQDQSAFGFLASSVLERAAYLCAMQLYAVFLYEKAHHKTEDTVNVQISVEGSTYYQLYGYQQRIRFYLGNFLRKHQVTPSFHRHEHASLKGAAMAAFYHA